MSVTKKQNLPHAVGFSFDSEQNSVRMSMEKEKIINRRLQDLFSEFGAIKGSTKLILCRSLDNQALMRNCKCLSFLFA